MEHNVEGASSSSSVDGSDPAQDIIETEKVSPPSLVHAPVLTSTGQEAHPEARLEAPPMGKPQHRPTPTPNSLLSTTAVSVSSRLTAPALLPLPPRLPRPHQHRKRQYRRPERGARPLRRPVQRHANNLLRVVRRLRARHQRAAQEHPAVCVHPHYSVSLSPPRGVGGCLLGLPGFLLRVGFDDMSLAADALSISSGLLFAGVVG